MKIIKKGLWKEVYPNEAVRPKYEIEDNQAVIRSSSESFSTGRLVAEVLLPPDAASCNFSVEILTECARAVALAAFRDSDGETLCEDYFLKETGTLYSLQMNLPEGAVSVEISFLFWSNGKGRAVFSNPSFDFGKQIPPRNVVAATAYIGSVHGKRTVETNCSEVLRMVDEAARLEEKPDILIFCETVLTHHTGFFALEAAMTDDDPRIAAVCRKAKQHGMYVILPVFEQSDKTVYNTALLIDRQGRICQRHRKTLLPYCEIAAGVAPGDTISVMETDFGKIAILICWEHYFSEPARLAQLKGAEMLFVPTLGDTEAQARSRAADTGLYTIVAGPRPVDSCKIISPLGELEKSIRSDVSAVIAQKIDLNARVYQDWLSVESRAVPNSVYRTECRFDLR